MAAADSTFSTTPVAHWSSQLTEPPAASESCIRLDCTCSQSSAIVQPSPPSVTAWSR